MENIKQKNDKLIRIKQELKDLFVGIDNVIDQLINAVKVWYIMPELMTRPMIVNLWGLTGTGKTTLIRAFAKLVEMSCSFIEIQMDNTSGSDIQRYIVSADIRPEHPSILLLDEIQRFRTIDQNGAEIQNKNFNDVWMLLSDGCFQSNHEKKSRIIGELMDTLYMDDINKNELLNDDKKEKKEHKYKRYHWSAISLKNLIKSPQSIEEIMQWSYEKKSEALQNALKNPLTFECDKYSKMLIFISGNIDEAYQMSTGVNDADTDADIFHEQSKKINIVSIKDALLKRFKPEQIARFGNNHIIYPSLSKKSFLEIIRKHVTQFCNNAKKTHNIKIIIDETVYKTIYENGVFPAQGVRPVLSTISSIFENYMTNLMLKALEENANMIKVKYRESYLVGDINGEEIKIPVNLDINKIKEGKTLSEKVLTSVHEAGHTIVYSILCKVTPTQIRSSTSSMNVNGFVGVHLMNLDKKYTSDIITVALAGQAAEEIVFGDEHKSSGAASDIAYATQIACDYVRTFGFDGFQCAIREPTSNTARHAVTDIEKTNPIIENFVNECKKKAIDVINGNHMYFREVAQKLINCGEVSPLEIKEIAEKYKIKLTCCSPNVRLIANYEEKWIHYKGE